jgi:hypothetical protein
MKTMLRSSLPIHQTPSITTGATQQILINFSVGVWTRFNLDHNAAQSAEGSALLVGFEVLTAVVINVSIFWDILPCISYVNRRFGGKFHLDLQPSKKPHYSRWLGVA